MVFISQFPSSNGWGPLQNVKSGSIRHKSQVCSYFQTASSICNKKPSTCISRVSAKKAWLVSDSIYYSPPFVIHLTIQINFTQFSILSQTSKISNWSWFLLLKKYNRSKRYSLLFRLLVILIISRLLTLRSNDDLLYHWNASVLKYDVLVCVAVARTAHLMSSLSIKVARYSTRLHIATSYLMIIWIDLSLPVKYLISFPEYLLVWAAYPQAQANAVGWVEYGMFIISPG
jgi:hypothetical protein